MGQVAITTPVTEGRGDALKAFLSALPRDTPPTADRPAPTALSPFTGALPPTHFARFVVIDLGDDDAPHLLFTSAFDGDTSEYLRALAATATAQAIWSHCQLPQSDRALTRSELERYLCDECNWRPAQYVVNALPDGVTVDAVNRALSLRAQLGALMMRAGVMEPTALAHDFRQLPAIQALMRR
jgi:hypothetical protein